MTSDNVLGNVYDKYGTRNPVARWLMAGFLSAVTDLYRQVGPRSVLEVGCGEGRLAHHLVTHGGRPERFDACDLSLDRLVPELDAMITFREASIYELPYEASSFDLVVCCEVLEHLEDPERGLRELARVSRGPVLISTPREPLWRLLNMARGQYLPALGNTPGHIQHFSSSDLERLAGNVLTDLQRRAPLPWTVLLGRASPHESQP